MIIEDYQQQTSPAARKAGRDNRTTVQNEGNTMLQRVKKQDIKTDTWAGPDALEYCLALWKDWMAVGGFRTNGSLVAGGLESECERHGADLYESQHSRDVEVAVATDAMIDSLQRVHIWAIYVSCGVSTTWRFPNADLAQTAFTAKAALQLKLKKMDVPVLSSCNFNILHSTKDLSYLANLAHYTEVSLLRKWRGL